MPDIAVFRTQRIPRDSDGQVANAFMIALDWAIEILSPGQSQTKVILNILHCLDHGTQMGWLIDPEEALIFAYSPNGTQGLEGADAELPVPAFAEAVHLMLGHVFDWLKE